MIHVLTEQTDHYDWEIQIVLEGPPIPKEAFEAFLLKELAPGMPDPPSDDLWKKAYSCGQSMTEITAIKASRKAHVQKVLNGRPWNVAFADYLLSAGEYKRLEFANHDFTMVTNPYAV